MNSKKKTLSDVDKLYFILYAIIYAWVWFAWYIVGSDDIFQFFFAVPTLLFLLILPFGTFVYSLMTFRRKRIRAFIPLLISILFTVLLLFVVNAVDTDDYRIHVDFPLNKASRMREIDAIKAGAHQPRFVLLDDTPLTEVLSNEEDDLVILFHIKQTLFGNVHGFVYNEKDNLTSSNLSFRYEMRGKVEPCWYLVRIYSADHEYRMENDPEYREKFYQSQSGTSADE